VHIPLLGHNTKVRPLKIVLPTLLLCIVVVATIITSITLTHASYTWLAFNDPRYGFSLQYPSNWTLIPENNGSNITLMDPITTTTLSPIVSTQHATPANILAQPLPAGARKQSLTSIAGHAAIDYILPYSIPKLAANRGPYGTQSQVVIVPVTNPANTAITTVYTFLMTQSTNGLGQLNTTEQGELPTFTSIVQKFVPPTRTLNADGTLAGINTNCYPARICWADNNWSDTYYTDDPANAYSIYCDDNGYNVAYSTNPACINGGNTKRAAIPTSNAYFQPNFECAEFITRALNQDSYLPGLNNGGVGGKYPASSWTSYGNYLGYDFLNVGTPTVKGLSQYLLNNNIAVDIGTNKALAQAGDIIFFRESNGYFGHAALITSATNGLILMDSHNIGQYHAELFNTSGFDIYHFKTGQRSLATGNNPNGSQEVLLHGSDGNVWYNSQNAANGIWSTWKPLQNTIQIQGNPTLAADQNGQLEAFALGTDGHLWHAVQDPQTAIWTWSMLQPGYTFLSRPAVAMDKQGRLELEIEGSDTNIWTSYQTAPNGSWFSIHRVPSQTSDPGFQGDPTLVTNQDGHLEIFALGRDGHIWQAPQNLSTGWWNWSVLQTGYAFAGQPTAALDLQQRLEIDARGIDGNIWTNYQTTPNGGWSSWHRVPSQTSNPGFLSEPTLALNQDGHLQTFAVGKDGNLWQASQNLSTGWWNWSVVYTSVNHNFQGIPAVGHNADGRLEVFIPDASGNIWHDVQATPSGAFAGWNML
jgi:hypothetical protein